MSYAGFTEHVTVVSPGCAFVEAEHFSFIVQIVLSSFLCVARTIVWAQNVIIVRLPVCLFVV